MVNLTFDDNPREDYLFVLFNGFLFFCVVYDSICLFFFHETNCTTVDDDTATNYTELSVDNLAMCSVRHSVTPVRMREPRKSYS